ncbi:MAG: hypothetical protein PHQ33_06305, partial [Bacteroidales bacterium]|nr:hypothetical protein [Bacteroidales bacterium]
MKKLFTILVAGLLAVSVNAQSADYQLVSFLDTANQPISALNLAADEDLIPTVALLNNGPDLVANADTVYFEVSVDGTALPGGMYLLGSQLAGVAVGTPISVGSNQPLFTAEQMDEAGITSAELC